MHIGKECGTGTCSSGGSLVLPVWLLSFLLDGVHLRKGVGDGYLATNPF